jgi:hypothetical protein
MEMDIPPVTPSPLLTGAPKSNTLAIISLGLGIGGFPFLCLSVVLGFCACISGLLAIGALVTGFIARQQIRASGEQGNEMALAGIIMGGTQIVLVFCAVLFWLVLMLGLSIGNIFSGQ